MGALEDKYPLLSYDDDDVPSDEAIAFRREQWDRQRALRGAASEYFENINIFLGSQFHDCDVHSIRFEDDCLSICVEDAVFLECFQAVNSLLGLGVPEEGIKCPVSIRFEGVDHFAAYLACDGENRSYAQVDASNHLPNIYQFIFDEIAGVTPDGISVGFELWTRNWKSVILDIDARSIRFEETLRTNFISLFGERNLDLFDAFWEARVNREIWLDAYDEIIAIIRSLRPVRTERYNINNYYVRHELESIAKRLEEENNLTRAADIYRELIHGRFEAKLCKKLGKCLFQAGQYNEALLYLYAAVGEYAKDLDVRFHLARTLYAMGQPSSAAEEIENCLEIDPNFGSALKFIEQHDDIREYLDLEDEA